MRLVLVAGLCIAAVAAAAEKPIELTAGELMTVDIAGIARIAVTDASIADVKTIGDGQVLVLAMEEGRTTLTVWKKSGETVSYPLNVKGGDPELTKARELELELERGSLVSWKATGVARVQVGDPAVIEATLKAGRLQVRTKAAGHSDLVAYGKGDAQIASLSVTVKSGERSVPVDAVMLQPGASIGLLVAGGTRATSSNPSAVVATMLSPGVLSLEAKKAGESAVDIDVQGEHQKLTVKVSKP